MDCGKKHGNFKGGSIGMWQGICDLCGEETSLAAAGHDFGIYNSEEEELFDETVGQI